MPILLLRELLSTSLSTLVEKAQKNDSIIKEYDLQLNNGHLDLILVPKSDGKVIVSSTDEGFESDIDSLSIVSSDTDSFTSEKLVVNGSKTETDSANGSSSSDSDTEVIDSKNKQIKLNLCEEKPKESYNLVECICYTDVKCTDILIFVIRNEAFVFKFDNLSHLHKFYTNFTTLKAVANQKVYNKNFGTRFNLLQRTDQNGVTHIEITRKPGSKSIKHDTFSNIISINTPGEIFENDSKIKTDIVNSRQRSESQFINDMKYNTINSKLGPKARIITKSNSIENILDLDQNKTNLVKESNLKKVWNSAEDLLDAPKRPVRRKKGKAPQPPVSAKEKQDIFSGQYVRVNVNFDPIKDFDKNRLIIKSSLNEPHPKKLQNFNILSNSKHSLASFLKPKDKQLMKYEQRKSETGTLDRCRVSSESNWMNSVPRILRKPNSKSETRNLVPMAYRYIDTTQDYSPNCSSRSNLTPSGHFLQNSVSIYGPNLALSNYLRGDNGNQNISNRLFGLSPKLRDFSSSEDTKWTEGNVNGIKDSSLKSVIKNGKEDASKKKNDKKVTFSAYTTVQVV